MSSGVHKVIIQLVPGMLSVNGHLFALIVIDLPGNFVKNQLLGVFKWAGEEGAGGLLVAAAAELGGDLTHVKLPPASQ